jgi:hypothetical protein
MDENNRTGGSMDANGDDESSESSGRFGRARDYFGNTYNSMRERVEDVDVGAITDQVRAYVRSNPGKALIFSVGVGFAIGLLLRAGDDED